MCASFGHERGQEAAHLRSNAFSVAEGIRAKPAWPEALAEPHHLLFFGVDLNECELVYDDAVPGLLCVCDPGHRVVLRHGGLDRLDDSF